MGVVQSNYVFKSTAEIFSSHSCRCSRGGHNAALGRMRRTFSILLALTTFPVFAKDACEAQYPGSLITQLTRTFPAYRAPVVKDNSAEGVAWDIKQGGKGCLGVAQADLDGDKAIDFLLGLTARSGDGGLVLVALARNNKWKFKQLSDWPRGRSSLYVDTGPPGTYERTSVLDGPLNPGEVTPMDCLTSVAVFGATEGSGVAYCFNRGSWQHVWISD